MRHFSPTLILFFFLLQLSLYSQEKHFLISFSASYITSSKIYYNTDNSNDTLKGQSLTLDHLWGFGLEVRRSFEEAGIQIGISADYIYKRQTFFIPLGGSGLVPARDGYLAIPVELTGYFIVPFSSETLQMYIGGGGGAYFGVRRYEVGDASANVTDKSMGLGIHVLTGFQYKIMSSIALRWELKFRDVQFNSTNLFNSPAGYYNGKVFALIPQPFNSRVSIDGMSVGAGVAYSF